MLFRSHIKVASYAKTLRDAGVRVLIGAHGQREGLAAHWEMWMLNQGGFTPWEALRSGSYDAAIALGMDKDLGSIEVGKLADIVITDGDVLNDIRRSELISHTMINGRLYDTETMNEIGNTVKERTKFYWENNKYNTSFPWHETSNSFTLPGCGCEIFHK